MDTGICLKPRRISLSISFMSLCSYPLQFSLKFQRQRRFYHTFQTSIKCSHIHAHKPKTVLSWLQRNYGGCVGTETSFSSDLNNEGILLAKWTTETLIREICTKHPRCATPPQIEKGWASRPMKKVDSGRVLVMLIFRASAACNTGDTIVYCLIIAKMECQSDKKSYILEMNDYHWTRGVWRSSGPLMTLF